MREGVNAGKMPGPGEKPVLTIDIIVLVLVEQVGHISPTAHVQALGYPFECHRCLLTQHLCCFDLLFISFWALLQPFFRPTQPPELFVNQRIGFLLVALMAFCSVVADGIDMRIQQSIRSV